MGWGRMILFGNWGQQLDIEDQKREIASLRRQIRRGSSSRDVADISQRVEELEKHNDEQRLYLAALVRYLGAKGFLQKDEFGSLVDAIDAEDGATDGGYKGDIAK